MRKNYFEFGKSHCLQLRLPVAADSRGGMAKRKPSPTKMWRALAPDRAVFERPAAREALFRTRVIQAWVAFFGRAVTARVCRQWRDTTQNLALSAKEERRLLLCVVRGYPDPVRHHPVGVHGRLMEKLRTCHLTHLELPRGSTNAGSDLAMASIGATLEPGSLLGLALPGCNHTTDSGLAFLFPICGRLTTVNFRGCGKLTDSAIVLLTRACPALTAVDISFCRRLTTASIIALAGREADEEVDEEQVSS